MVGKTNKQTATRPGGGGGGCKNGGREDIGGGGKPRGIILGGGRGTVDIDVTVILESEMVPGLMEL